MTSCVLYILRRITRDQLCLLNSSDAYKLLKHTRPRLLNENQTKITFEDVAGIDEAKEELEEIVEFLK